jgi:hypothetical protein
VSVGRDLPSELLAMAARRWRPSFGVELEEALAVRIPSGAYQGYLLGDLAVLDNTEWVEWASRRPAGAWPAAFWQALQIVVRERFPHLSASDERREAA